jgi:hypothetical protein
MDFFFSSSIFQKNDMAKILGMFDIRRSLKVKNMQKQANLIRSVRIK